MAKILMVDDDPDFLEASKLVLELQHHTVLTANNVQDGEEKIFKEVWQEKGYPLGDRIYELPQAVATILAKYLGTLKL